MSISKNIRLKYKRKAVLSLLFLLLLVIVWLIYPFQEFFSPVKIAGNRSASTINKDVKYVEVTDITLYYTGYCNQKSSQPKGFFYYGFVGNKCLFFLLENDTCHNGQESITFSAIRGTVYRNQTVFNQMMTYLAEDLAWDQTQLTTVSQPYLINETGYNYGFHIFLLILFTTICMVTVLKLAINLTFMTNPGLSLMPVCGFSPKRAVKFLAVAEKELESRCLFTAGSFSVTKRFILDLSRRTPLIIPIKKIAWVYEHSTVSGFPGRNGKITYTLTFYNTRKRPVYSTHNQKEDVDTVLSYLRDYYPEILNGYTEENKEMFKNYHRI